MSVRADVLPEQRVIAYGVGIQRRLAAFRDSSAIRRTWLRGYVTSATVALAERTTRRAPCQRLAPASDVAGRCLFQNATTLLTGTYATARTPPKSTRTAPRPRPRVRVSPLNMASCRSLRIASGLSPSTVTFSDSFDAGPNISNECPVPMTPLDAHSLDARNVSVQHLPVRCSEAAERSRPSETLRIGTPSASATAGVCRRHSP